MTIDMNTRITDVVLTKVCKVKPDGDSTDSKTLTVKMDYNGLTLGDVFQKALRTDIISFQGTARKKFDSYTNNSTVKVKASAPASAPQADPMDVIIASAKAAGMSVEDYIVKELAKRS